MEPIRELKPEELRFTYDENLFEYKSTADVSELVEIVGQERAVETIEFGIGMEESGFNIFAIGPTGAGKTTMIRRFVEEKARKELSELDRYTVLFAVDYHIDALKDKFREISAIVSYLDAVQEDIVANARSILASDREPEENAAPSPELVLTKDRINLVVDNSQTEGAPVVVENNSSFPNLVGRIERQAQFGMLVTDFTMINPGALHRANGGYLIVEADHLFQQPHAYDALKQAIKERQIRITDLGEMYSMMSAVGIEPEAIPLDVKIIIIGNPTVYYSLYGMDAESPELFKVKADFNSFMERTNENMQLYARFLAARCREGGWRHFDRGGIGILTGVEAGEEQPDGSFPPGTVGHAVDKKLKSYAACLKEYRKEAGKGQQNQ